jgi:hypothetical protein
MRTIKTRETARGIKALDKTVDLSKRMKDTFVRTKELAEETRGPRSSSPSGYAIDNIQDKTQGAALGTALRLPNPRQKDVENMERARSHFQEAKRQLPKERRLAAEQAQKTAAKTKDSANSLRKTANEAQKTASEAKTAVKDAKQTLKQVRLEGRQTLREVRQIEKLGRSGKLPGLQKGANSARGGATSPINSTMPNANPVSVTRPHLGKSVSAPKSAGDAAKPVGESARAIKSATKGFKDTAKGSVKSARKSVKTAEKSAKAAVKTAQQTARAAQRTAQATARTAKAAEKAARAAAKVAAKTAKAAAIAVTAMVKAAIAAVQGLVAAIAAGGWVAVVIILIICMIALLVGSTFGIFFSSEPDPGTGQTVNGVITEINTEYTGKIDSIISENPHDLLDMSGARAAWKQVLAVYTVKTVSDPNNPMEVATMTDEKAAILRSVFWDMNMITHKTSSFSIVEDVLDEDGLPTGETTTITKTVLQVIVSHKTVDEMAVQYGFTDEQIEWLEELLKADYHGLWNALLYGITSVGDSSMIEIADTQIGNIGGEPYWSWYGFSERVEWCACFVSWCAEMCGYIEAGILPKFAGCDIGVGWFKRNGQWQDGGYTPAPGDIIFFDWNGNGSSDHVGIVERVDDEFVYTIEGNTSDSCARRSYRLDSGKIFGYGVPAYL